ncbi:MAG: H-NS histone family protein [Chlorobiaceae bacterium]
MPTIAELNAQIAELQRQVAEQKAEGRKEAVKQIKSLMIEFDLTVDDLQVRNILSKTAKVKVPSVIKYRKGDLAWVGRGPKPEWFKADEANGVDMSQYLVG